MSDNKLLQALENKPYLNFAEYMEYALYHPQCGYYMQDPSPIGRDFVTAPLLSPLLAKAVSSWLDMNNITHVMEIGAGSGVLAKQLLNNQNIQSYCILDKNLKASEDIQDSRCRWVSEVGCFEGAIIANELLDAFPFRRFCLQEGGLYEFVVDREARMKLVPVDQPLLPKEVLLQLQSMPRPYVFEYCDYAPFFKQLKQARAKLLLIDYGYNGYQPDHALGTMMCYKNHQSIPFSLSKTGKMDITCAVNWKLLESVAFEHGFRINHMGTQKDFIAHMVTLASEMLDKRTLRLLCEHEMGEFIKVVELRKNTEP